MSVYHWYAEVYGWPPQVVDELTLDQVTWLPIQKQAQNDAIERYRSQHAHDNDLGAANEPFPGGILMAKILWHSTAPWANSGYGSQTALWTRKLSEAGHEVIVSSYWGLSGSVTQWEQMPVLPGYGSNYCSTSLGDHARHVKPDLIITLGDIWVMDPNILRDLPVAHWLPSDCRPMSLADRGCLEASGAQVIAMSCFGFDRFTTAGFRPFYVPHGIDTDIFSPGAEEKVREAAGVTGKFIIGINAANNDAIRKAIPEHMLAFAKFLENHPDALLALHTGVHQEGGQDLEAIAENVGITDHVQVVDQYRYHSGLVSVEDMAVWYRIIDLLAAASYGEGFGLPIMEAQACGTPVITTAASSMTELNPYGISVTGEPFWNGVHKGWWVKPSVGQLTEAFEKAYLAKDADHLLLRQWAENYSLDKVAEQYMFPVVEELLERVKDKV